MSIGTRLDRLLARMHGQPQYPAQGAALFVDLERREVRRAYLPLEVLRAFLGGRGANMFLLYNLLQDGRDALDPEVPLIFGVGPLTGGVCGGTRANATSISPDSHALLDASAGDYFPVWLKRHGYDHLVVYGRAPEWTLLQIAHESVTFHDARPYLGLDNLDTCAAIERDFGCTERRDMALARITSAGENLVLSAGIMGGPKAIWARGGGGAKMGSLRLKAVLIRGRLREPRYPEDPKELNRSLVDQVLSTSVIRNALRKTGTPFLYRPSRVLGALGTKNNQETTWVDALDADNYDVYRPGMDGCFKCAVRCRAGNDLTPEGKGGWGARALSGLTGNASYDKAQSTLAHDRKRAWKGRSGDGVYDRHDRGDGPEYVTVGKFGPNIGIREPEHVLRLNNILNDLGLDSASTGGALAWAMELYQRGIISRRETGGLDLSWGNYPVVERLLFMTARREGFGDVIADSSRAVERGKYPAQALDYRMTVKGLFQSDPHDARILKAFALGLAVATRGMDHLRNRATLEINARINDDPELKASLYGGKVAPEPDSYDGKEWAVRRCENTYAVGDALGMCRFQTKLFNSPTLPGYEQFVALLRGLTGQTFQVDELDEIGRNITGLERLVNHRIGLRAADDTLPRRWFTEGNTAGPFAGARIDPEEFARLKARYYAVTGLTSEGIPAARWHRKLAEVVTGFAVKVKTLGALDQGGEREFVLDQPVATVEELRAALADRLPHAAEQLRDGMIALTVNGNLVLSRERSVAVRSGDEVHLIVAIAGG
ncbi:MAG TPA: aldehyde ferredoxin oxidoreductase C-terminal domain-containing protein [Anaeromyxobacteraceae bacterium]|nr:aldehyde ferredoxin oxidoreductase C-terminal domain-containing protein [Anaeromyxobacteraceae bacterium]